MQISVDELYELILLYKKSSLLDDNGVDCNPIKLQSDFSAKLFDKSESDYIPPIDHVGNKIRSLRQSAGKAQGILAIELGITQGMLSQIERGTKTISLPLAKQLAEKLNCSIYDFLDEKET